MKKLKFKLCVFLCTICFSCSTEETDNSITQDVESDITTLELRTQLINSGPWVVDSYEVFDVTFSSSDMITNEEISNHIIKRQLRGYTAEFFENGTVKINFPVVGEQEHIRTWQILLGSILIFNDSQIPQFWQNATVKDNILSIDLDIYSVVEDYPAVVEHFGRLQFKSKSIIEN